MWNKWDLFQRVSGSQWFDDDDDEEEEDVDTLR